MSRIAGIIGLGSPDESGLLLRHMLEAMRREASDVVVTLGDASPLTVCGAVVPCSQHFAQPIWNEDRNVVCLVSGNAFTNKADLHQQLRFRGHSVVEADRTGLVHLYEEHGVDALSLLNGWFSGVLLDLRRRQAILFNDRYGLSRIYVYEEEGLFFFSSEAKSLLALFPALRELEPRGLAEWFSCGCTLGNRTLFRGISILPPGSAWIFSGDGTVKKRTYFSPSGWENQSALSPEDYYQQLTRVFPRILERYTNSSQPVAMSLTGGLDGRMIMAWARPNKGEMPCYTFNGPYRDCADVRIARKVAAACGQPHQTISVGDDFLAQFPRLAEQTVRISDGAMDVSGAAELYVNRLARQIAPVRLTGSYGSEILRRHVAFKPRALTTEIFSLDFAPQLALAARTYSEEAQGNQLSFIAFKQVPWHHYARLAVEQSQISVRTPFLDNDLVALAFQAPPELATSLAPPLRLIAEGNLMLGRIPTDRGISYSADRITNRLHRSIHEFLARAEYAYDYGMPNWLARVDRALQPLRLDRLFLGRQKFCHFRSWYRHQLAAYVKEILLDPSSRSRSYVNGPALERLVKSHVNGLRNYTLEIHKLLSIELLHRALLDGSGT
jgi:asparagine synthase (glutamine-hydrolysing)